MVKPHPFFEKQKHNTSKAEQNKPKNKGDETADKHQYDHAASSCKQNFTFTPSGKRNPWRSAEKINGTSLVNNIGFNNKQSSSPFVNCNSERSSKSFNQTENLFNGFPPTTDSHQYECETTTPNKEKEFVFTPINRNEFLFGSSSNRLVGGSQTTRQPYFVLNIFGAEPLPLYYDPEEQQEANCIVAPNKWKSTSDVLETVRESGKCSLKLKKKLEENMDENKCKKQLQKEINKNSTQNSKKKLSNDINNSYKDIKPKKTTNQEPQIQLKKSEQKKQSIVKPVKEKSNKAVKVNKATSKESLSRLEGEIFSIIMKGVKRSSNIQNITQKDSEIKQQKPQKDNSQQRYEYKCMTDTEKNKNTQKKIIIKTPQDIFISIKDAKPTKPPANAPVNVQKILHYCQHKRHKEENINNTKHFSVCPKCCQNDIKNDELETKKKKLKKIGYFKPIFSEKPRKQIKKKISIRKFCNKYKQSQSSVKFNSGIAFFDKKKKKEEKLLKIEKKIPNKGKVATVERVKRYRNKADQHNVRIKPKEQETHSDYFHIVDIKYDTRLDKSDKNAIERNFKGKEKECIQDDKMVQHITDFHNVVSNHEEKTNEVKSNTPLSKEELERKIIEAIRRRRREKKNQKKQTGLFKNTQPGKLIVTKQTQIRKEVHKLIRNETNKQKKKTENNQYESTKAGSQKNENGQIMESPKLNDLLKQTLQKAKKLKKKARKSLQRKINCGGNNRNAKLLQNRKLVTIETETVPEILADKEKYGEALASMCLGISLKDLIRKHFIKKYKLIKLLKQELNDLQEKCKAEQLENQSEAKISIQTDNTESINTIKNKKQKDKQKTNNKGNSAKEVVFIKISNKSDTNKRLIRKKHRN